MKMTQLLSRIGDDNIEFQNLDKCITRLEFKKKVGTTITFGTDMNIFHDRGTEKIGLIIWLDRDAVDSIMAEGASHDRP